MSVFRRLPIWAAALLMIQAGSGSLILADEPISSAVAEFRPNADSPPAQTLKSSPEARSKRVLLIVPSDCQRCREELARLAQPGGPFAALQQQGWAIGSGPENHLQIVDLAAQGDAAPLALIRDLNPQGALKVVAIEGDEVIRSFQRGCTTPLDQWTLGWLMTGNDERPVEFVPEPIEVPTSGHYRLRGNHWSIEGNWNPTREEVARHLRTVHGAQLHSDWQIESWSIDELKSLHDDLHEREEGFRGRYSPSGRPASSGQSVFRKPGNAAR